MNAGFARLNPPIDRPKSRDRRFPAREVLGLWVRLLRPIIEQGRSIGFALLVASLFPDAEKVSKKSCPCIRVSLRSTSLIPSTLRGPAYKGHPWPFTPLAASMPLAPLRADSIRPSERGVRRRLAGRAMEKQEAVSSQGHLINGRQPFVGWKTAKHFPPKLALESAPNLSEIRWVSFALPTLRLAPATTSLHGLSDTTESPLSGGRAQVAWKGLSGMDAARAALGHGWPVAAGPWNVTGAREVERSETRMQGQAFLLTFLATEKSESPSRAKPMRRPTRPIGINPRSPSPNASWPRPLSQQAKPKLQFAAWPSGAFTVTSKVPQC